MFAKNDNRMGCPCGNDENKGFFGIEEDAQEFNPYFGDGFGGENRDESFEHSAQGCGHYVGQEFEHQDKGFGQQGQGFEHQGKGFSPQGQGCSQNQGCPPDQTRRFVSNTNVNGKVCNINNRCYYDNYCNRYNRYCVNDVNYVKRYLRDINVWYYTTKTIDCGTEYLGASNVNSKHPCSNRDVCGNDCCDWC